jgi:L-arabinose isomerase
MDVFAEAADACFMDAWLPAYLKEPKGTSLVVIRKSELDKLFLQGQSKRELHLDAIDPEGVVQSQGSHVRRKRELIYMRRGIQEPKDTGKAKPTTAERISWWLQRRVQIRSKISWVRYGRKYSRVAFWFSLADILLMQNVVKYVTKTILFPKKLAGRLRRALAE